MAYEPPDPPVIPYLMVHDGPGALGWYARAFGAEVKVRYDMEDGRVGHALIGVNGGDLYLADEFPQAIETVGALTPRTLGGTTVTISLAVDDVDAWLTRTIAEGAEVITPAVDEFYGRIAKLRDPYGHVWSLLGPKAG